MTELPQLKTIFEYDNYRAFLRDYYLYRKATDTKFSYRYFARIGGFKSGNILKIVIDGQINITDETIQKFCKALKLNKEESLFFRNLVHFNQSTLSEERARYSQELLRSRTFKQIYPLSENQYRYFDCWYFPIVRGLVALVEFQEDPEWIASQVNPPITPGEAKRALAGLLELGLLSRNETGRLTQINPTVTTSNAITSSSLAHYHREMLKKAGESIDRVPRAHRDLSAMTLSLSNESVRMINELTEKFRRDVVDVASRDQNPDVVFQLNTYFFPVTQIKAERDGK
jgi:uncharacterized protein (TIGR02147 family)